MLSFVLLSIITVVFSLIFTGLFRKLDLIKGNYKGVHVPYSGGTIIILGISTGYLITYIIDGVSFFKFLFFSVSFLVIYAIGIFEDLYGVRYLDEKAGAAKSVLNRKLIMRFIRIFGILGVSSYSYLFFSEEYWLIKGILTTVIVNFFNLMDLRPGRTIKAYYFFFLIFLFTPLMWTRELYYITFVVLSAYYYFDAYGVSTMGYSGSGITGFAIGLMVTEALSTSIFSIGLLASAVVFIQLSFESKFFAEIIRRSQILDFIDRLLTERQEGENVRS